MTLKYFFKHSDYNELTLHNDIGLLKLDREVKLDKQIQLACLPNPSKPIRLQENKTKIYSPGWGELR